MNQITEYLVKNHGFDFIRGSDEIVTDNKLDYDKFSCVLRIGEIHYLFYSDHHKHFSIGVRLEIPRGQSGVKGKKQWNCIMIPKVIKSTAAADKLLNAIL